MSNYIHGAADFFIAHLYVLALITAPGFRAADFFIAHLYVLALITAPGFRASS